jgi:hypothetical protein
MLLTCRSWTVKLAMNFACFWAEKRASGMLLHFSPLPLVVHSFLGIFNLTLCYAILCSLHIRIKFIAFTCYEICSSYNFFNNVLEIIKMLCLRDLNSRSLHNMVN